jgi:hypothetical protein
MRGRTGADGKMRKETGLIMSTPMMIADLKKTKTQTRRTWGLKKINENPDDWFLINTMAQKYGKCDDLVWWLFEHHRTGERKMIKCPYGGVGDEVWLKESLKKKPDYSWCKEGYAVYVADGKQVLIGGAGINEGVPWEWKRDILTGMFMPRWASRKSHILTNIRCERVQAITEEDAIKEGVECTEYWLPTADNSDNKNHIRAYAYLWNKLNGDKYPWNKNVYTWILEWGE